MLKQPHAVDVLGEFLNLIDVSAVVLPGSPELLDQIPTRLRPMPGNDMFAQ